MKESIKDMLTGLEKSPPLAWLFVLLLLLAVGVDLYVVATPTVSNIYLFPSVIMMLVSGLALLRIMYVLGKNALGDNPDEINKLRSGFVKFATIYALACACGLIGAGLFLS